ncbi:hypothetical protein GA0115260_1063216 [Streptomyces sp. MnatMP-M27]|nr:hypothetical protein GA0115260_1063216 [Streptomyces sp. MnatMP-M27]
MQSRSGRGTDQHGAGLPESRRGQHSRGRLLRRTRARAGPASSVVVRSPSASQADPALGPGDVRRLTAIAALDRRTLGEGQHAARTEALTNRSSSRAESVNRTARRRRILRRRHPDSGSGSPRRPPGAAPGQRCQPIGAGGPELSQGQVHAYGALPSVATCATLPSFPQPRSSTAGPQLKPRILRSCGPASRQRAYVNSCRCQGVGAVHVAPAPVGRFGPEIGVHRVPGSRDGVEGAAAPLQLCRAPLPRSVGTWWMKCPATRWKKAA